ncbi:MAG: hypothetical protein U0574_03170 [Phycisphaerales bacterium]
MTATTHAIGEPVLPPAQMHLVLPTAPVTARVVSNELCMKGKSASFVRHVVIDVGGTPLEGNFLAGQSFGIVPPGVDAHGKPHKVRLYSIASPGYGEDGRGRVMSTTPKRLIAEREPQTAGESAEDHSLFLGRCSNYLCDLRPGDPVQVSGPSGKRFVLPVDRNAHDYLLLATGTGIAPFRGFIHELFVGPPEDSPARAGWAACRSQVHLVMGTPYTTDLLYDDFLREVAARHPNFHYHVAISRESRPDGGRGEYVHQLLDRRWAEFQPLFTSSRTLLYVCGLAGMQVGLFQLLGARGVHGGFVTVGPEIAEVPPATWTPDQVKRRVRPTHRCMLEVY